MSMLKAAGTTVTVALNSVTMTANQINKGLIALDQSTDLLVSNATVWAQRGISRNNQILKQLDVEADHALAVYFAEKNAAHRQWLAADSHRAEDFAEAQALVAKLKTT